MGREKYQGTFGGAFEAWQNSEQGRRAEAWYKAQERAKGRFDWLERVVPPHGWIEFSVGGQWFWEGWIVGRLDEKGRLRGRTFDPGIFLVECESAGKFRHRFLDDAGYGYHNGSGHGYSNLSVEGWEAIGKEGVAMPFAVRKTEHHLGVHTGDILGGPNSMNSSFEWDFVTYGFNPDLLKCFRLWVWKKGFWSYQPLRPGYNL